METLEPAAPDYTCRYTVAEYVALEARAGLRHGFYHGEIFPLEGPDAAPAMMAGGTRRHNQLVQNCGHALDRRLTPDSSCLFYTESVRTAVDDGQHYLYPDLVATCDPQDRGETITQPSLIIEVLLHFA